MVTGRQWIMAGAVAAIGLIAFFFLFPGDEARIKQQFAFIAKTIAKSPGESPLVAAANAKRVREAFTATVTIHAPVYGYRREMAAAELPALVLSARTSYADLALAFYDAHIDFPQANLADVRVTARLRGRLTSGENVEDIQELNCRFKKIKNDWRIEAIEVIDVLKP